jgi:hypothetical protein
LRGPARSLAASSGSSTAALAARTHTAIAAESRTRCATVAAMKLAGIPFQSIDWSRIDPTSHPGAPGMATWRTLEVGNVRVRKVEYSAGYVADHWCERGHVLFVLDGELFTELRDGRSFTLGPGQGYIVATGDGAHRSRSPRGARLFIVD